jgi:hypothetical protein
MLDLDDQRWAILKGGYRVPFDARPLLRSLESGVGLEETWQNLWNELHHQGDVGEASFAAVPHLVRIHQNRGVVDWNTYAMVATIELARGKGGNPDAPAWLRGPYDEAIHQLARLGLAELPLADGADVARCILGVLALEKGARTYARVLIEFTEDEIIELAKDQWGEDAG